MKKTVVILLSDKRSGSTMFQRELCKHPEIQTVSYSPHTYLETHHWLKAAVMLDVNPSLFSGGKVYQGYGTKKNARTYMEDCIHKNVPDFEIPSNDRELVFQGWEALCERFTKPVFFEKSPQFLAHWGTLELILEWMEQTTFDVKVIGMVRNPLSVLYSAQELFHTDPEKRQYGWLEIHENLIRLSNCLTSDQFMLCKYEDIIQQPVQTFGKICRFIGVGQNDALGAQVHSSSVNKWASDPFFTLQLDNSVKIMARQFGYTDKELDNPAKPHPPFIQKIKRKIKGELKLFTARLKDRVIIPVLLRMKQDF